ncbi:MAG: putative sulfate/molybdate transporter [Arenicellales bacterium]
MPEANESDEDSPTAPALAARPGRVSLNEISGAFGDLGTLIPFVVGYLAVVELDPTAVLIAFGVAYIAIGAVYRTPMAVQPMKAIGTVAVAQSIPVALLTPATIQAAGLVTAVVWTLLAVTGLARRAAALVPRQVTVGIVMGLGLSLMLHAITLISKGWAVGAILMAVALMLLGRRSFLAMLVLLLVGALLAFVDDPTLAGRLAASGAGPRLPNIGFSGIGWSELWVGATLLALPQVPLTLGNALIATVEQSNRLFPDHPITERRVALSTGLMNFWSAAVHGVPLCHGAGGMAGHVQFGARTGWAPIIIGALLLVGGVFFAGAVALFFRAFPEPVLGVILFLAGAQLALANCDLGHVKNQRFLALTTAALAIWHVGIAFVFGLLLEQALKRRWVHL